MPRPLLIVAGGFKRRYANDKDEIEANRNGSWFPSTIDFEHTAKLSGGNYYLANNASTFFGALTKPSKISRVVFIGHGGVIG